MDMLTWSGSLGPYLNPLMLGAVAVFFAAFLLNLAMNLIGLRQAEPIVNPDHTISYRYGPVDYALLAMKYSVFAVLAALAAYIVAGILQPSMESKGIIGALGAQFLPVWIALVATFVFSIRFKRRLGLYGKLFDNLIGMIGFGLVMFWIFTAIFAPTIATHGALDVVASLRNDAPGIAVPNAAADGVFPYYLLGGDALGRDVFSRMVFGAREVLTIAPAATLFAFMVGITLGLPAGYMGGRFDTLITFIANLVLAFPVILLFYLLVTPEIVEAGVPVYMASVLFIMPVIFVWVLLYSRYRAQPNIIKWVAIPITLVLLLLYLGTVFRFDPFVWLATSFIGYLNQGNPVSEWMTQTREAYEPLIGIPIDGNLLIVFVSVVFVNSPTVFRIVRGLVLDIKTRDYVAAAQTRGEGPWYIMLWEILPNARGPLIVDFCLRIGYTTILLGTLGFFGLGVDPESPNWGSTINEGRRLLTVYPHPPLPPALALMTLVLGLNLLADGLREESLKD
jgi:peptide/nickel transport system permease protein